MNRGEDGCQEDLACGINQIKDVGFRQGATMSSVPFRNTTLNQGIPSMNDSRFVIPKDCSQPSTISHVKSWGLLNIGFRTRRLFGPRIPDGFREELPSLLDFGC